MPRADHKEGCQCAVCKRMAAKVPVAIPQAPEAKGVAVGTLFVGRQFKYQPNRSILNAPVHTYIKYGTDKGIVTVEDVASGDILKLPESTLVSRA